ncbi:MAG TPA: MurR/RpiR family transcriptional regulator [Kaistia sp.]|nr:MurR/RpiR family transcriptional regulator [Kaistia sp.]
MAERKKADAKPGRGAETPRETRDEVEGEASGRKSALGYTRPRTYEELRAVLASGTLHFPKRLRQVAIFLWQHPDDVALGTIVQVAEQAGVQPSTLVRFAKTFGFAGFSDLQGLFKDHVKGSWPEARGRTEPTTRSETHAELHFLGGIVAAARASLDRIGESFDVASFEAMIEVLAGADLIYLVGSKRAFPVTAYLSLTLSQQGVRNILVDNVGSTAFDQIGCIGRGDALLAVSFSPYNSITPDLVAVAHERSAQIVTITDSTFSPLIPLSTRWIEVIESDFAGFRSLAASLSVGMALVHGVVAKRSAGRRQGR